MWADGGGDCDRGGAEPLRALRGVITLKEPSVISRFQWVSDSADAAQDDGLVYESYGLTEEEIAIVEGRNH